MTVGVFIFSIALIGSAIGEEFHYVKTSYGTVRGQKSSANENVTYAISYLAIPYAKPPVGDLRFREPQPIDPWNNTLIADKKPPACIQYSQYPYPWYDSKAGKSEDCLYLNIWTPLNTAFKRPVMFYIHGGGFSMGSGRQDYFDGHNMAFDFDNPSDPDSMPNNVGPGLYGVIVVTINYRLGAFGFLSSGTDDAPGNVGLLDMVMALKWVNENIVAFGGDPNQITLFGQGAGSIAITLLCVNPLTNGMFQRVFLDGGTFLSVRENKTSHNLELTQRLAKAVGCTSEDKNIYKDPQSTVKCLRGANATQLAVVLNSFNPMSSYAFYPQFSGDFLNFNPVEALQSGSFQDIDMIISTTGDEGSYLLTTMYPEVFGIFGEHDVGVNKSFAESILRKAFKKYSDQEKIVQFFLNDVKKDVKDKRKETEAANRKTIFTVLGADRIVCPTVYFAEKYGDKTSKVFFYRWNAHPPNFPWSKWMGSVHFNNQPYMFYPTLGYSETSPRSKSYSSSQGQYDFFFRILVNNFAYTGKNFHPDDASFSSKHHKYYEDYDNEKTYDTTLEDKTEHKRQEAKDKLQEKYCNFLKPYHEI